MNPQPRFTLFLQLLHKHPQKFQEQYPNLSKSPFRLKLRQYETNENVLDWDERDFRLWANNSLEEGKIEKKPEYQPFDPDMLEGVAVIVYDREKGENGESRGELFTSDDFTIPDKYLA
jgi:hypothetical protein